VTPARPGRARLLAVVLACAAGLAVGLPAHAAPLAAQDDDEPSLRLASQTPWVGRGEVFQLGVVAEDAGRSDLELTVAVHRPITSRSDFARTIEGRVQGTAFTTRPAALDALQPVGGVRLVQLPVQDPALPRDPGRISLRGAGVYPVRVELSESGGGDVLDSFVTHLVYLPEAIDAPPLHVAWVAPVHAPPALQPNGTRRLQPSAATGAATLAAQLEARSGVAFTLAPTPETIEALAAGGRATERETLSRLAALVQRPESQLLGGPYVPVSLPAYTGALESEGTEQISTGFEVVADVLGERPDPRTRVVTGALTDAALDDLRDAQVDRVVVEDSALAPLALQVTLAQSFQLGRSEGRRLDATLADAGLTGHFRRTDDPALAAHQLLADLAVIWFDAPARRRGVVALPPRSWRPTAAFLEPFLDGLARSPVLAPVTLDSVFEDVPAASGARGRPLVRTLPTRPDAGPSLPVADVRAARDRIDAFGAVLTPGEPVFNRMERTLLAGQSADLRAGRRSEYLRGARRQVDAELGRIQAPAHRSITLTARRGRIPVTISKDLPYPVRVVLRVDSDQLRVVGGNTRTLELTRRNTTELFTVQARTSGAFPLRVTLESPDGRLNLASSRFTVRSTAASGVGVILSVGAGWVLLVWWIRHGLHRRRRARRAS
jgi:hypothetical protein